MAKLSSIKPVPSAKKVGDRHLKKLKIELPHDPAIPLLGLMMTEGEEQIRCLGMQTHTAIFKINNQQRPTV